MAITISGENNNDRITAQDGVIDTISGFNISGIITASSFTGDLTGDVTGNVTGNINNSTLLLQTGSTERVRITSDGKISTGTLASPDGNLHVYSSSAGSVTAASDANELVLESSANVGMSFLTATNSLSRIKFGDSRQSNRGVIAYSHSADSIIFHTVGNERSRITSGGDILIGRNTGLTDAKVSIQCDAGESGIAVQLNTTTGTSNLLQAYSSAGPNVASITVNPTATPDLMFNVWDGSSTTERLRITSAGNVGIGTDNPSQLLHLEKDSYHRILLKRVGAAPSEAIFANLGSYTEISNNASGVKFSTGSTPTGVMVVRSGGNVGIGTNNPGKLLEIFGTDPTIKLRDSSGDAYVLIEADSADQGSLRFRADPLDAGSGSHIRFDTDGDERLRISPGGNVYVGQTSGSEQLGVDGGSNSQTFSTNSTNSNGNMLQVKCSGTTKLFLGSAGSFITGNTGTTNQGIRAEGALVFAAGGHTERARIDSSGNVSIGSAPGSGVGLLNIRPGSGDDTYLKFRRAADFNASFDGTAIDSRNSANSANKDLLVRFNKCAIWAGGTEKITIANDGKATFKEGLYVSNTVPSITLTDSANSQYAFIDGNSGNLTLHSDKGASGGNSYLKLAVDNNVKMHMDDNGRTLFRTNGSQTSPIADNNVPVQIAESTGNMCYFGANLGNSYGALFGYHAAYGGTVIRNVSTSDIVFYTNSTTERLRIDHSANTVTVKNAEFQVNNQELQVTSSNSYACHFNYQDGGSNYISFKNTGSTTFRNNVGAGQVMVVYGSGNIGAPTGNNIYNASDERLKENMVELTNGLDKIKKLKPYSFTWKKGFDKDLEGVTQYGFGAHQAKSVDEKLVEKFSENDIELDGETIKDPLRVNEKHVIPLLVKAIQELSAKVAALEGS